MKIVKNVIKAGSHSRAIYLPKLWIKAQERKLGRKLTQVEMEVNDEIVIRAVKEETKKP